MSFLKNTIGFIAAMAFVPAVFAAPTTPTARPSIVAQTAARTPTMRINTGATPTTVNAAAADQECIENYTDCLKGGDVCGSAFEECTNKTLFFAKRPLCTSTLLQCSSGAITSLFGTSSTSNFANKDKNSEEYTYPTAGSILGQLIEAAHINNRYDTAQCVRRYTDCLKKDDVCGADFELCTSNTEFKKQKLFCESTLARCQNDGLKELFGTTSTSANPGSASRIGIMIKEGGDLAAVNSVATCYKVADQCILNTCATNPYKCIEGSNRALVSSVDTINEDGTKTTTNTYGLDAVNKAEISGFIKKNCLDTIGGNKFCYATFIGDGKMPSDSQIKDEDNRADIYSYAYTARMTDSMKSKIDELREKFDKKTKQRCADTITACAMRSCGEGSGAACYASAFDSSLTIADRGVTNSSTLPDIKYGCESIVNNDTACQYAGATFDTTIGALDFMDSGLFDKLFTAPNADSNPDPIGVVAALNSKLSLSYNQAALDQMRRQCQSIATGCVKTMCGTDYENCYRNRTDVYSTLTATTDDAFNKSMNKVGGVLDYTIVLGLCLNTVKDNPICEEHIKAEAARTKAGKDVTSVWGKAANTRDGWLGAGVYSATVISGDNVQDVDDNDNLLCTTAANNAGEVGRCDDVSGTFIYPKTTTNSAYQIAQAEKTIFRNLVYDLEKEAQAKYNAKLTKQQNMCVASSSAGGVMGAGDISSTFMWVKLKSGKVPKAYNVNGLKSNEFVASNDLYGSFCRIRVTLQSDEPNIQTTLATGKDWSSAYFAAGDAFTCGSWIPRSELEAISNKVGAAAKAEEKRGDTANRNWMTLLGTVLGGTGGGIGMNALQKTGLGGLLGTNSTDKNQTQLTRCKSYVDAYKKTSNGKTAESYATGAVEAAKEIADNATNAAMTAATNAATAAAVSTLVYDDEVVTAAGKTAQATEIRNAKVVKDAANTAMDQLKTFCETEFETSKGKSSKTWFNIAGVGVGSAVGGILTYQATKSVQEAAANNAEAAAKAAWMQDVGNHIRCYIGSDEVGMYGDIISTEME